ncbi:V-type proton ATPase 116 kDa subunit a-like [Centruroides sculpturatus]|uniref:V-type proton ATPase 116 kDa subunit a-like n=1 Tax=Centruroides sculpturatus TaxID=218467 RepID=UPI000C6D8E3C|nr:V-type proton ATPase 116 kDa subunit a-like [Centruroides sculpturatus]
MGSLFRSEEMTLCQLFLQSEAAYACVSELGELGMVQFRDLNPDVNAFQRKFVNEVRRCDEMERKLRFLEKEIKKDGIPMFDIGDNPEAPQPREMIDMEAKFEKLENELKEVNTNAEALKKTYLELTELKHILRKTQAFFDEQGHSMVQGQTDSMDKSLVTHEVTGAPAQLGFVAGVILRERLPAFERMLWRVCRGNVFLRQADIETPLEDPVTGAQVHKSVVVIFFQGEQLKTRVKKICEGFQATLYPCPETPADRREMSIGVMTRIEDLNTVKLLSVPKTKERLKGCKFQSSEEVKVTKVVRAFKTAQKFASNTVLASDEEEQSGSTVPSILNRMETKEIPPTYNRTNKFSQGFQNIVDAYGVANYREVNPAPYTIITFPFLFAVMFGDAGHGLLMFLFAAWMVLKEKGLAAQKSDNEIWTTFFNGRYIILLMGGFSIYTGLIYNDAFSKSLNIFGSSWLAPKISNEFYPPKEVLNPKEFDVPYPFGIDPVWQIAENKIIFMNSYKMKVSVILGVGQMLFGVLLSLWNHRYFNHKLNIICEFIPQIIFLVSIFGYLVIMIFSKWSNWTSEDSGCAPSLLIMLINMFLFKYPDEPCYLRPMYAGQPFIQGILVVLALLCVPWMLFAKPYLLHRQWLNRPSLMNVNKNQLEGNAEDDGEVVYHDAGPKSPPSSQSHEQDKSDHFDFGDVFIHQAIHTIEYCLGSISHTASYLRLWALSLAHAQLSEVLWTMVMRIGLRVGGWGGGIVLYFIFAGWAVLTIGVLLIMEGLSAFLHALRLHWVEFQSKFYGGTGYIFVPFSFDTILEQASMED